MITTEHKSKIDKIWITFHSNGMSTTLNIVEQLTYLIFIKNLDEIETKNELKARRGLPHKKIFGEDQQKFRWKNLKEMSVEERHQIFADPNNGIFPFIRSLGAEKSVFATHMRNANYGISKPQLLDSVMDQLEGIDMTNQDAKGDIYEYMLSKMEGGGTSGQFRTPRHIIKMMVALMKPTLEDTICDPAAGTAGFLVNAKEYIDENNSITDLDKARDHINKEMFNGMEFDSTMLRIASMNLYLHGIQEPNIYDGDALSKDNTISNAYTLILANPPFKGTIDKETISPSLKNITGTTKTELLFLALMLRQLKIGGRCAVIVPDGVLFGAGKAFQSIRKEIVENNKLEAVISLPGGVFKPYAGVSTAILIFTKTDSGGTDNVWFYDMKADGKSLDDKRDLLVDARIIDSLKLPEGITEEEKEKLHEKFNIPEILERFFNRHKESRGRTEQSFLVPKKEISDNDWNLSVNGYKRVVYEEIHYEEPEVLIHEIQDIDKERMNLISKLKNNL